MQESEVFAKVAETIREVFSAPEVHVQSETTAADVDGWDSLSHAIFLMTVERRFGVRLEPREMLSIDCVGDLVALLTSKLPV